MYFTKMNNYNLFNDSSIWHNMKKSSGFKEQTIPACSVSKSSFQDMDYDHKSKTREKGTVIIGLEVHLFT